MAGKIDLYDLGKKGVDVSRSSLHRQDGTFESAQNVVPGLEGEENAIRIRNGLISIGTVGAGPLTGAVDVQLNAVVTRTFMVPIDQDATSAYQWVTSTTNWASSATATSPAASDKTNPDAALDQRAFGRLAFSATKLYYPAEDAGSDPIINSWDGSVAVAVAAVPRNPSTTGPAAAMYVYDMLLDGTYLYFIVHDSTTTNAMKSRVLQLDVTTGAIQVIGERFGAESGALGSGGVIALSLAKHNGSLYVGTGEGNKNQSATGKIYRIRPNVDTSWTLDGTLNAKENPQCMVSYKGLLYVGCWFGAGAVAGRMMVRAADGTYSQSTDSGGTHSGATSGWYAMSVFGDNLYAGAYDAAGASSTGKIYKFDNSSWSSVKTIGTAASPKIAVAMVVSQSVLYVLCSDGSAGQVSYSANGSAWTDFTTNLGTGIQGRMGLVIS
jgi:hypothetical protein